MSDRTIALAVVVMGAVFCYYMMQDEDEVEDKDGSSPTRITAKGNETIEVHSNPEGKVEHKKLQASSPPRSPTNLSQASPGDCLFRAAFDVGSGATKIAIAQCVPNKSLNAGTDEGTSPGSGIQSYNVCMPLLHEDYQEVLLRHSLNPEGFIAQETLDRCYRVLSGYAQKAREIGCSEMFGIATAVFRDSKNGQDFLDKVSRNLGIQIDIVSQALEGKIGYRTAVTASLSTSQRFISRSPSKSRGSREVIAWDSGGGSFQITSSKGDMYGGQVGSSTALKIMMENVQGRKFSGSSHCSCNPCSIQDCVGLKNYLELNCMPPVANWLAQMVKGGAASGLRVVSIGGSTCAFCMAQLATECDVFGPHDVWEAIELLTGHDDESLTVLGFPQPEMLLPKLVLVYTVMQWVRFHEVEYVATTGSTLGLLATPMEELRHV